MARSIKPMMGVELKVGLSSEAEFAALAIVFVSSVDWLKEIFDLGLSFARKLASCWRLYAAKTEPKLACLISLVRSPVRGDFVDILVQFLSE